MEEVIKQLVRTYCPSATELYVVKSNTTIRAIHENKTSAEKHCKWLNLRMKYYEIVRIPYYTAFDPTNWTLYDEYPKYKERLNNKKRKMVYLYDLGIVTCI